MQRGTQLFHAVQAKCINTPLNCHHNSGRGYCSDFTSGSPFSINQRQVSLGLIQPVSLVFQWGHPERLRMRLWSLVKKYSESPQNTARRQNCDRFLVCKGHPISVYLCPLDPVPLLTDFLISTSIPYVIGTLSRVFVAKEKWGGVR